MNLTRNLSLLELTKSDTAIRKGIDNVELFDWIKNNLEPDQLILEFYTPGEPNSGWIHCSWVPEGRRASFLHAYKSEGKTKYKPILGSAKELF